MALGIEATEQLGQNESWKVLSETYSWLTYARIPTSAQSLWLLFIQFILCMLKDRMGVGLEEEDRIEEFYKSLQQTRISPEIVVVVAPTDRDDSKNEKSGPVI